MAEAGGSLTFLDLRKTQDGGDDRLSLIECLDRLELRRLSVAARRDEASSTTEIIEIIDKTTFQAWEQGVLHSAAPSRKMCCQSRF